ncbi:ABC transporter substrate-binding protein [Pararobbsia silviterrae]|uniref:ABC transporter substrate-binding protein n=1 Tax=Pararobbsia silviterrae TaxID=1792498 RepID=A0A494XIX6_9BURK|nr:ABC transporter substrate-binding protein [Pararobbsia silviterrae]RKP49671.1 ABC transporter substrate-binding protein [Pararobbsia silviterrae]
MRLLHRVALFAVGMSAAVAHAATPPDILVVAQSLDDIVSLDPAEGFELSSVQAFTSVYERLAEPDRDDPRQLDPVLAQSWNTGADGHSLTFTLRSGATFASGRAVDADDVVWSLRRAVTLNRAPAFILNELGWTAANVAEHVIALDAAHVRITWPKAVGPSFALNVLTAPVASILDAREVRAHDVANDAGNAWLHLHSAGSGPFSIRRYIPHEALVLAANPSSPGGAPHVRTIVIKNVADAATRRLLVEVGDADIARDLGPDQVAALQGEAGLATLRLPSAAVHYLLLNAGNTENPVLANPAFWEAARWLVDYDGIANTLLKGTFEVHQAFLANGVPGALNTTPYHLDIARAKAILARAGIHDATLTLDVFNQPPFPDIAQSLQATFGAAGITVRILPGTASEVYARTRTRTEQAAWLYWIPDYFDPNSTASAFASNPEDGTATIAARAAWHIPALTDLTRQAVAERDPARRIALYTQIQTHVQANSPFVIALQAHEQIVLRSNVHGYQQGLDADMVYYDRVSK